MWWHRGSVLGAAACALSLLWAQGGCTETTIPFDPGDPGRGPGELVGNDGPITPGVYPGGDDALPTVSAVTPPAAGETPDCGAECLTHCGAQALDNPVNRGLCPSLWGVGLAPRPVEPVEACRRLVVDLVGRYPTRAEVEQSCVGRPWGDVARELMATDAFVLLNQRRWADKLLYNNTAVSVERIFDMDRLVGKLYRGEVPYDQFAAVVSAHPVVTRRYATAGDRAEAVFSMMLGRPPYENERADLARLYVLWGNGYYDHPVLLSRLPDAVIDYRCVTEEGAVDPVTKGECTSVLWGYNELILTPDLRARDGEMWSGLLRPGEWYEVQLPGRILSSQLGFWENAADEVLEQYLGYDLGTLVPEVRQELVAYVLEHQGDLRALHYAVVTSVAYLQSAAGESPTDHRWTWGPLKQVEVEPWIDTIKATTGYQLSQCDHRLSDPEAILDEGTLSGLALVQGTGWELTDDGDVVGDYRNLARTLGGCPENEVGGRFKTVSILTTAAQEAFVAEVCNAILEPGVGGAATERLLPDGVHPDKALDAELAERIVEHQIGLFFGRAPSATERSEAWDDADRCAPKPCTAEMFARPACYALLSSAEMLFY